MRALWPNPRDVVDDGALDDYYAWPAARWVRSNMVASLDGAAQSPGGGTRTLSSVADRRVLGVVRSLSDAIVVGAGTARTEGYRVLQPRERYAAQRVTNGQAAAPALVLVSASAHLDEHGHLFEGAVAPTILATTSQGVAQASADVRRHVDILECGDESVDLNFLVEALSKRGLNHIVAEGGPHLLGSLVAHGLVDDMAVTIAPVVVGGSYGDVQPSRILAGEHLRVAVGRTEPGV